MKQHVIIAPNYRLGEYAARFILEVSPRSCIFVSLDSRGDCEKLNGLSDDLLNFHYFYAPRMDWTQEMRMNYEIMNHILAPRNIELTIHRLP